MGWHIEAAWPNRQKQEKSNGIPALGINYPFNINQADPCMTVWG